MVGAVLSIQYYGPRSHVKTSHSASYNETVIIPYSSVWCQSMSFQMVPFVTAKFYLLDSKPKLTDHDTFSVWKKYVFVVNGNFEYYMFYLHPGSNISITICSSTDLPLGGIFKLIIGNDNFTKWQDDIFSRSSPYVNFSFDITTNCSRPHPRFIFNIDQMNEYYLVFVFVNHKTVIETSLQLYRTKYGIIENNILNYCLTQADQPVCYLDIPYNEDHVTLVALDPPASQSDDTAWLSTLSINPDCTDRYALYIGIALALAVFILFVSSIVTFGCCFLLHNNKQHRFNSFTEADVQLNYGAVLN